MRKFSTILIVLLGVSSLILFAFKTESNKNSTPFLTHIVNPSKSKLQFYWKDDKGNLIRNFANLKSYTESKGEKLVFAMNAGMYTKEKSPLGLYVEKGKTIRPLNQRQEGYGNFYLHPNGVFYLTKDKKAVVCQSSEFKPSDDIEFATQSGPMLLINGKIHPKFNKGSSNLHIRNAVGILPTGETIMVMSKKKINFYDLATYFKEQGCQNALYLDGFVSKTYLPDKNWEQTDGNFGVMIGETSPVN